METYPEQFPDESQPDPSYLSEDRVFDAIQDNDRPGSTNHEGQPDLEAPPDPKWTSSYRCRT